MLLEARPDCAARLLLHPEGLENEGVKKLREQCAALGVREEDGMLLCRVGIPLDATGAAHEYAVTLYRDREALIAQIDKALAGEVRFRRAVELGL